jgi:hypothetical protein
MAENSNPLRKYFRQPSIFIRLPSGGKHYPAGTLIMPPNQEIPVLPMTAVDEITSRTPDALFNGSATVNIINSCIPNIKDAWAVPSTDVNALLVACRIASYGHEMELNTVCPKCGHEHNFDLDLRVVLDSFQTPDYDTPLKIGDLTIFFQPMSYRDLNETGKAQFEDQKLMQLLPTADMPDEEKMAKLGEAFRKITELTVNSIAHSISAIQTSDAMVTDSDHIADFLHNCSKSIFDAVKDRAIALRVASDIRPIAIKCQECSNEYQQEFTLDMTNFFETAS